MGHSETGIPEFIELLQTALLTVLSLITVSESHCIISQNHRVVGVGRDLCGSSSPTLLPKQGHLQQAAQDCV